MKKVLAGIAILAVAAAAQAELLATWTFDAANNSASVSPNTSAANAGQVTFGTLSRVNGLSEATTRASSFTANKWDATGGDVGNGKAGIGFTLNVNTGYEVADSVIAVAGANRNNSGPASVQWTLGNANVGDAWSLATASSMSEKTTGSAGFTVSAGNNTLLLVAPSATASGGRVDLRGGSMTFDGNIKATGDTPQPAIPEPATLSLLGLGALAVALRRKLRK